MVLKKLPLKPLRVNLQTPEHSSNGSLFGECFYDYISSHSYFSYHQILPFGFRTAQWREYFAVMGSAPKPHAGGSSPSPCQTSCGASREKAPQILDSKDLRGFLFFPVRKMIFCFFLKNPLITLLLQSMQRINRL